MQLYLHKSRSRRRVLIVGKQPPPIGGVTVHVSRLIAALKELGFNQFDTCEPNLKHWPEVFYKLISFKIIHLHISNPHLQLLVAIFCKLTQKRLLITYHGNWGRYDYLGNLSVSLSAALAAIPIVQNAESYKQALRWNSNTRLISTYIPGNQHINSNPKLAKDPREIKSRFSKIFCTNAWNVTFHNNGLETYGISQLIRSMQRYADAALMIADPSGNYARYLSDIGLKIPGNVFFLSYPHDFRQVLQSSDAFIRNTVTDGVSISIHEALEMGIPVFASNAVSRAKGCFVYENIEDLDLLSSLEEAKSLLKDTEVCLGEEPVRQLLALYKKCLGSF